MSYWVMSNISFKVDEGYMGVQEIQALVGRTVSFKDRLDGVDYTINCLPQGSEQTLNIVVEKTSKQYTKFRVCGGLRDRYDTEDIEEWIQKLIERNEDKKRNHDLPLILEIKGFARADSSEPVRFNYKYEFSKSEKLERAVWPIRWRYYVVSMVIWEFFHSLK